MNNNPPSKAEWVNMLRNSRTDGTMMMEPRLQEYLKKKKMYKLNNIAPCINLEQEFQITSRDRKSIRSFLKGRTDLYHDQPSSLEKKNRRSNDKKKLFPSSLNGLREDSRVKVFNNDNEMPPNMGMFYPNEEEAFYEINQNPNPVNPLMDVRDFGQSHGPKYPIGGVEQYNKPLESTHKNKNLKNVTGYPLDEQRFDPRSDLRMDPGPQTKDKYTSQYRVHKHDVRNNHIISNLNNNNPNADMINDTGINSACGNTSYSNFPDYQQNDYNLVTNQQQNNFARESNHNNGYGNLGRQSYSEKSVMDFDNKMVIPKVSNNTNKNLNTANYKTMPFFANPNGSDNIKIDVETAMIRGMPTNTTKSYGYRNPSDHYYQFTGEEFGPQVVNNLVEPWARGGESTRRDNKSVAKETHRYNQ
jgi:hypothetical protein